jgi:HPt (histidine-containing phosphotransfer) domain-containing protein
MTRTTAEPWSEMSLLNEKSTLDRLKGDTEFLTTLYNVFVGDLPKKIASIEEAMQQQDMNALQRSAHSLKGASATVGADALREVSFSLEVAAKDNDAEAAKNLVPVLMDMAEKTSAHIQKSL